VGVLRNKKSALALLHPDAGTELNAFSKALAITSIVSTGTLIGPAASARFNVAPLEL
jgi:hypothetical protein